MLPLDRFDDSQKNNRSKKMFCRDCCIELSRMSKAAMKRHPRCLSHGKTYGSRHYWLKKLGFETYQEYLDSPLWRRIRQLVFKTKGTSLTKTGHRRARQRIWV